MQQRYYDPGIGRFLSIDPVTANSVNGTNFNRYWYGNNNPYRFSDPDGRLAVPMALGGCAISGPACPAGAAVGAVVGKILTIIGVAVVLNEVAEGGDSPSNQEVGGKAPPLPEDLVGENPEVRGSGGSATSGTLSPEYGGSGGDYDSDLVTLAGETHPAGPGESAPEGAQIGANGVFGREVNSSGGRSIDIPANGDKPHETLHYPPREKL
ncbi:RHS repeat-associated core domain-containing protein [Arenimonas alkanexedens]